MLGLIARLTQQSVGSVDKLRNAVKSVARDLVASSTVCLLTGGAILAADVTASRLRRTSR
jgi:hypothetical protein